ncbi:RHS repeat-associated core domain-containing protein [Pseudomonas laurylsulfatiphila]
MNNPSVHHATPTLAVTDPRGLAVRGVGYWRAAVGQTPRPRVTRQVFDAAGRGVEQWDARLPVPAMGHGFSLTGTVLATDSVDAGWRVLLLGQAGETLSQWDSRGSRQDFEHDTSLRPTAVMEQARGEAVRVVERFKYGAADIEVGNQCGRLIRHDDPAGTRYMPEYDLLGLAQSEVSHFLTELDTPDWPLDESARDALLESGVGLESRWSYSPAGDLLSLVDASSHRRRFGYTVAGQLKEGWLQPVNNPAPGHCLVHDIRYNPSNQVERETAGNGVITKAEYAPSDGRLLRLAAGLPGASPLQDLSYEVDAAGNIVGIKDHALPVRFFRNQRIEALRTFDYDSLGQLISATGWEAERSSVYPISQYRTSADPNAVLNYREEYDYDPAGNMTELRHLGAQPFTRSWAVAANSNRSLLEDDQPPDFDKHFDRNGNLRFLQRGQAMTWDLRNQLSSVSPVQRENEADDTERYLYGGGGKRLRKVRTSLMDARAVTTEVRYLPGLEIHFRSRAPVHQVLDLEAGRNRVKWLQGPHAPAFALRYHLTDHLGSGTLELDDHANVQSREAYYPFGGTAWEDHSDQSGAWKTIRYSGKERDATGLYYYGYRYFAPWLSRWINPDPAGAVDGLNLYGFVGNSPVGKVDRDGRMKVSAEEFRKAGGVFRNKDELASDKQQVMRGLIAEELHPALAVLASSAITGSYDGDSLASSIGSEAGLLSFAGLAGDLDAPSGLEEIKLAPLTTVDPSSSASGSSGASSGLPKKHTCPDCGKAFLPRDFTQHLRVHTDERPYACEVSGCGKRFKRSSHLTVHNRTHTGDKPYACTFPGCNLKFKQIGHRTRHLLEHTGDKPFACTFSGCNLKFKQSTQRDSHLRGHTGDKPYACTFSGCNIKFKSSSHLTYHLRGHTGDKPYACTFSGCDLKFKSSSSRAGHYRRNHPM